MNLDARLSRTSALPREMPRKINRLHNFEAHAEGLKYCPVLEQRRICPAVFCGTWNIAVALLRIIITTGLDIGAKSPVNTLFSCGFSQVSRF